MSTIDRAKRTRDTRRLYKFEEEWFRGEPNLPMNRLQDLAYDIWCYAGPHFHNFLDKTKPAKPIPAVVAGKGTRYNGRYYSYYDGERVVLARNERKKFVLIHEMVHALGYDDHDEAFVEKYFELLDYYNVCDSRTLTQIGVQYGLCEEPDADIW